MKKKFKFSCVLFTAIILLTSCEKDPVPPKETPPPVANAGNSQVVQLPVKDNEVTLTGSGISVNGKIVGYLWSLVSGPNVPVITSPSATTTTVKELNAGTYIFQFAVIDSIGLTGVDTVSVLVKPPVQKIATIQPANNIYEGHIDSYNVTSFSNGDTQFDITAWTANGSEENQRTCLKLDFTGVSSTSIIDSAVLYLFAATKPHGGNNIDANFGSANAGYIQRITGVWPTSNPAYSWNKQPATTTSNQVIIPQSTSSASNTVLNITELVRDMQQFGNNGFFMKLQSEQIYNIQQYASSFNTDPSLHPKLVIWYH
jgi:hypothetical protein